MELWGWRNASLHLVPEQGHVKVPFVSLGVGHLAVYVVLIFLSQILLQQAGWLKFARDSSLLAPQVEGKKSGMTQAA